MVIAFFFYIYLFFNIKSVTVCDQISLSKDQCREIESVMAVRGNSRQVLLTFYPVLLMDAEVHLL